MTKIQTALSLAVLVGTSVASAEIDTNNIADWNGTSNTVGGGNWSYLQVRNGTQAAPETVNFLTQHFVFSPTAKENWTLDANNVNKSWYVDEYGGTYSDAIRTGWGYTADEDGQVRIQGSMTGTSGYYFDIFMTTDTDESTIDMSTLSAPLFAEFNQVGIDGTSNFDFTVDLEAGNDIIFVMNSTHYWYLPRTLDATITSVPEPGTYALIAGFAGLAFVALRRRR